MARREIRAVAAAAILAVGPASASLAAKPTHDDEITTYATAVAISQVASDRCPEVLAYPDGLTALQSYLHLTPADEMAVQLEIRGRMKMFTDDFVASSSPHAWCNKALTHFGQDGDLMRGLLRRR